jgi:hypothetical protein
VVGDSYVYLVGGTNGVASTGLVYQAPIYADGRIGAFLRGPSLLTALRDPCVAKIGNYLYSFGGYIDDATGARNIVQRAFINPDGTPQAWQYYKSDRYVLPFATGFTQDVALYQNWAYILSGHTYGGGNPALAAIAQGSIR